MSSLLHPRKVAPGAREESTLETLFNLWLPDFPVKNPSDDRLSHVRLGCCTSPPLDGLRSKTPGTAEAATADAAAADRPGSCCYCCFGLIGYGYCYNNSSRNSPSPSDSTTTSFQWIYFARLSARKMPEIFRGVRLVAHKVHPRSVLFSPDRLYHLQLTHVHKPSRMCLILSLVR